MICYYIVFHLELSAEISYFLSNDNDIYEPLHIETILKCIMKIGFSHTQNSILHIFLYLSFHIVSIKLGNRI